MKLHVQKWLSQNNGNFELLEKQLGITANFHHTDERVILNYDQIESPKLNPIVKECRGLILNRYTFEVIAMAFPRFFNLDENDGHKGFVWEDCTCEEKVDGSLILLYQYNNQVCVNTRNSFGEGEVNNSGKTWRELVLSCLPGLTTQDIGTNTLVFELCSPYNKVVKQYSTCLYLLTIVCNKNLFEYTTEFRDRIARALQVNRPRYYKVNNREELTHLIQKLETQDKTNEGVVLQDKNGLRVKLKTQSYLRLHRIKNNNQIKIEDLIKLILENETDEFLVYFPEYTEIVSNISTHINLVLSNLIDIYNDNKNKLNQKDFALAVKHHQYSAILFNARKRNLPIQSVFNDFIDLLSKSYKGFY